MENDFDINAAAESIAADLNFDSSQGNTSQADDVDIDPVIDSSDTPTPNSVADNTIAPTPRAAPGTWPKEKHANWSALDKDTQDYLELREKQMLDGLNQYKGDSSFGKQFREITSPYKDLLQSQGVDEAKAVQYLLNAHQRLSTLNGQEKFDYLTQIAKSYGIDLSVKAGGSEQQQQTDPLIKSLQSELNALKSNLNQRDQRVLTETRDRIGKDVDAFASDPAHAYFDEIATEVADMIRLGCSIQDAYDKAVWANPVTRAKEMSRIQTENEAKFKEKAKNEANLAKKAASSNIRSRDTTKAPTETLGTMDETLKSTFNEIRSRAN